MKTTVKTQQRKRKLVKVIKMKKIIKQKKYHKKKLQRKKENKTD